MNARDALRLAARSHVHVSLADDGQVMLEASGDVDDNLFVEVVETLRPHRESVRSLLQEFRVSACASNAVLVAQTFLRDGVLISCSPTECNFHCGNPGNDCMRCGAKWRDHAPMINSREPRFK
jgi:hypothetical protein